MPERRPLLSPHAPSPGGATSTERLSTHLARRLDVPRERITLTRSGTEALTLALEAVSRSGAEGPIAIPGYTCWDVGTAVQAAGRQARFFDIDPATLEPDLASVENALAAGCVALIVSPLFGYPLAWAELKRLARRYGSVLVEDAAQSHGARWPDGTPGTLGDLSVLSFGRGKGWTGAGGGCLVIRSDRLASPVPRPARPSTASAVGCVGRAVAQAILGRPALYGLPASIPWLRLGDSVYHPPTAPHGMAAFQAALVLATEPAAEKEAVARHERASLLLRRLHATSRVRPVRPGGPGRPGFLRLPVLLESPSRPWTRTARRLGIVRAYPRALPDVEELRVIRSAPPAPLPGSRLLADRLFTVPTHSLLRPEELDRIVALLAQA